MKINPYQFTKRVEFGIWQESEPDDNGQQQGAHFKPQFKVWFGYRQQTLNQQYTLEGLDERNTKLIAIRHNKKIEAGMYCRIDGDIFEIISDSSDERTGTGLNAYDLLTLRRTEKRGVSRG